MSENEETSSSERVKGDEYVLKKANEAKNLKEEEKKGTTVKVDIKKTLLLKNEISYLTYTDKRKKYKNNK